MKILLVFILTFCLFASVFSQETVYNIRFGEDKMLREHHKHKINNPTNLTVHLVPHSHDDVGFIKTIDEYYYGSQQQIQWGGVQYTLDTVVSELSKNSQYRFSVVQMAFLYRWWNNAEPQRKQAFKDLLNKGQIQFINGGWCMSDEATTYYEDVIDQMTMGLRWMKQTFDYVPDIAWHIDPFGHQASTISMFNKMGMQAIFFARIDYQDRQKRMSEKQLEMIWQPKTTIPDSTNYMFTHVNYYLYSPPPGYCFDVACRYFTDPVMDDQSLEQYNLIKKAQDFVNYFKSMSLHYRSNTLMHTMGGDFHYSNSRMYFKNIDKLMKFINNRPEYGVKLIYSTPGTYLQQLQTQGIKYPTKEDDFFPYADVQNAYWTGYFVSRVAVKGFVRDLGRWIQAIRKHIAEIKIRGTSDIIKQNYEEVEAKLWNLQGSMGILQHHDGVSGTQRQRVANDYIATALRSIYKITPLYRQIIREEISQEIGESVSESSINFNIYWNETAKQTGIADSLIANKTVLLGLYNPGQAQKRQIRVSVPDHDLRVENADNQPITGDVFCASTWDSSHCELVFSIDLPESANGYVKIAYDTKNATAKVVKLKELGLIDAAKGFNLSATAYVKITKSTQKFDLTIGDNTDSFTLNYNYYESYQGDGQKSGAYIFRPASNTPKKFSNIKVIHYAEGTEGVYIVLEGDHTVSKLFFSKMAGYIDSKGFQIESRIDSIPISDKVGKQVTLNLATNFNNNNTFYTDSNGLEEQVRVLNYRPTWPLVVNEPVSGNYYPINSHIGFTDVDSKRKLTIITDRSQGGSVIRNGEIEIMVHRRTLYDDVRGVGEPMNETEPSDSGKGLIQTVRHYVVFGNDYRKVQVQNDQRVAVTFADSASKTFAKHNINKAPITVPSGVKLYLRPFADNSYLMRVQSFLTDSVSVSLPAGWQATEYTLSANQLQADWAKKQYKWNKESESTESVDEKSHLREETADGISLNFLQIKTFKIIKTQQLKEEQSIIVVE